jgi:hypothetical protein
VYFSPNIIQAIKSRGMKWVGHVVCMKDRRGAYRVLVAGDIREIDHLEDLGTDGE